MEQNTNPNIPAQGAYESSNPVNGTFADQEAAYYAALKRVEDEKQAAKKEKKRKRRIGCATFILVIFLIMIVSSISDSIQRSVLSNEPITQLDIREVIVYAKQNGVDNANNKFRSHSSGYNYRYKCVARYDSSIVSENVIIASIPYWTEENNADSINFVTTRIEAPPEHMPEEYSDYVADYYLADYVDLVNPLEGAWLLLDNVKIDVYVSNSAGALATPIIDSESVVKIVYSEEEALEWLNSDN